MKEYQIVTLQSEEFDWSRIAAAPIDEYPWGGDYRPRAEARGVLLAGRGFLFRLSCAEQNPTAVYESHDDPVYRDSCLECFCAFCDGDARYVNMEMNADGALLSEFGTGRGDRKKLSALLDAPLQTVAVQDDEGWSVSVYVPFEVLETLYGVDRAQFVSGYAFRGNFSKCGDDTPHPHFGLWSPVNSEAPDFHRPECFGRLVIV